MNELIQLVGELVEGRSLATRETCLVNLLELESTDVDYPGISRLLEYRDGLFEPDLKARVGLVAVKPHIFGLARMIELRGSADERSIRTFRSRDEAEAWLLRE